MMVGSLISNAKTIDPSNLLMIKIRGIEEFADCVVQKTKILDQFPIADIYSTVSTRVELITLIQTYQKPLYIAMKTDFVAPDTTSSLAVVVPAMKI